MKKFLLVLSTLLVAGTAGAQWNHHHRHLEPRAVVVERNDWVAPLIIGGIAGAVIANARQPQPVIVQPQPVIVQREPVIVQREPVIVQREPVCTSWKEIQTLDGQIYRERSCY
jgi:hypothetical protein